MTDAIETPLSTPGDAAATSPRRPRDTGVGRRHLRRLLTPWTIVILTPLLVLALDPTNLGPVVGFAARAFAGTLPYIAFAVILIAWLKAAGAEAVVGRAFQGRETQAIMLAALFGGLAPFCSCEVIPFIAGLLAVGAPLSAIMAFWLSSPLIDPPTLLITAAALGWPFAVGKAVAAVALGLFGGFAVKAMVRGGLFADPVRAISTGGCGCGPSPFKGKPVWRFWTEGARRGVFRTELAENALFLVKWLAMAYVLEALLVTYVPASLIAGVVGGDGVGSVVIAALVGMPAYLNSYVAPPLLAGLMEQGMAAGAAMAFMVAGAVSSIPAMAAVWSLVKPGVFATYLGLGVSGAIVAGLIFQLAI
ncbi:permease [Bauldia sp.]|uniref:permease n=1 Tax=Bauldia sp. TaxID=2575872 RepID=UPI003BAA4344